MQCHMICNTSVFLFLRQFIIPHITQSSVVKWMFSFHMWHLIPWMFQRRTKLEGRMGTKTRTWIFSILPFLSRVGSLSALPISSFLQQLHPSLADAGLSSLSLIWSGKSYVSTSDSCLRALRAIVWKACSTLMASLALVSK